jgi:hypothetical protein
MELIFLEEGKGVSAEFGSSDREAKNSGKVMLEVKEERKGSRVGDNCEL